MINAARLLSVSGLRDASAPLLSSHPNPAPPHLVAQSPSPPPGWELLAGVVASGLPSSPSLRYHPLPVSPPFTYPLVIRSRAFAGAIWQIPSGLIGAVVANGSDCCWDGASRSLRFRVRRVPISVSCVDFGALDFVSVTGSWRDAGSGEVVLCGVEMNSIGVSLRLNVCWGNHELLMRLLPDTCYSDCLGVCSDAVLYVWVRLKLRSLHGL